jgi:hypothetical protein
MTDDRVTSADQDAWVSLAEQVRAKLAESVPLVPAMKPDEAKTFVEALQAAYWLHMNTTLFDKKAELELARVSPE